MKHPRLTLFVAAGLTALIFIAVVPFSAATQPARLICDIWPPYQIERDGIVGGFSTEIVKAVYGRMNTPIRSIQALPWKRALNSLEHDHADALFSANLTTERLHFARYPAEALFDSPWIVWTRKNSPVQTLEDLKGKKIGVVLGYSYTNSFWEFIRSHCILEMVRTDDINFRKLEAGRLDATVAEYGNGLHLIQSMELKTIAPRRKIEIKKDGLYIMFNRQTVSADFVEEFSRQLKAFKKTPEHEALRRKHFGE